MKYVKTVKSQDFQLFLPNFDFHILSLLELPFLQPPL